MGLQALRRPFLPPLATGSPASIPRTSPPHKALPESHSHCEGSRPGGLPSDGRSPGLRMFEATWQPLSRDLWDSRLWRRSCRQSRPRERRRPGLLFRLARNGVWSKLDSSIPDVCPGLRRERVLRRRCSRAVRTPSSRSRIEHKMEGRQQEVWPVGLGHERIDGP